MIEPGPLPERAEALCETLAAPPRLRAHLRLVHQAAEGLLAGLEARFPGIELDRRLILLGAAIHDLGKVQHPSELERPGKRHAADGPAKLEAAGLTPEEARFARTHHTWPEDDDAALEDLLVALADLVWKGRRDEMLELLAAAALADRCFLPEVEAFSALDEILDDLSLEADERIAWQRSFPSSK